MPLMITSVALYRPTKYKTHKVKTGTLDQTLHNKHHLSPLHTTAHHLPFDAHHGPGAFFVFVDVNEFVGVSELPAPDDLQRCSDHFCPNIYVAVAFLHVVQDLQTGREIEEYKCIETVIYRYV